MNIYKSLIYIYGQILIHVRRGAQFPQLRTIFIDKFKRSDHHVYTRIAGRNGAQIRSELEGNAREKLVITNDKKRLLRCKRNVLKDFGGGAGKSLVAFYPRNGKNGADRVSPSRAFKPSAILHALDGFFRPSRLLLRQLLNGLNIEMKRNPNVNVITDQKIKPMRDFSRRDRSIRFESICTAR